MPATAMGSLIAIDRGLASWPGELVIWGPLAAVSGTVTLLLLVSVRPGSKAR